MQIGTPEAEYWLPNSGIIYASRDDALPDLSGTPAESATDFKLDPTRRTNGIRLINGLRLARGVGNNYENKTEKGLILATNVPAYVKGHLNLHLPSNATKTTFAPGSENELEEFTEQLTPPSPTDPTAGWSNFYTRGNASGDKLERQFACREDQPLCRGVGDQWRPATIIADAVTLQSTNYKEGYRNQGDFDLSNFRDSYAGSQVGQGFFNNSFVTSAAWYNTGNNLPNTNSQVSYLANGVTPIQRRVRAYAFQTESCDTIPVTECTAWADSTNTASVPTDPVDQRKAQRVKFEKAPGTQPGTYKYEYGVDGYPVILPTNVTTTPVNNALWFRTRDGSGNPSYDEVKIYTSSSHLRFQIWVCRALRGSEYG
jgi:hypothetical protein